MLGDSVYLLQIIFSCLVRIGRAKIIPGFYTEGSPNILSHKTIYNEGITWAQREEIPSVKSPSDYHRL